MTLLETPEPDLDRAFALATRRGEALLAAAPAAGPWGSRLRLAEALLAAGRRAPVRAVVRDFAAREAASVEAAPALRWLLDRYTAWTGDLELAPAGWGPSGRSGRPGETPAEPASLSGPSLETARAFLAHPDGADADVTAAVLEIGLGLWGVEPDAPGGALIVRPRLPDPWPRMALRRLRVGATVIDLELRRPGDLVARVRRAGGPRLFLSLEPRPPHRGPILLDEIELQGGRARFELAERHEIVFRVPP